MVQTNNGEQQNVITLKENTDSDFFNLTDENESQSMDPFTLMRNISNTIVCSGTSSMIQIQESGSTTEIPNI